MKLAVICFTKKGALICRRLYTYFKARGEDCEACVPERFLEEAWRADGMRFRGKESLEQWSGRCFSDQRAMIFIGAAGIAVRAAAPWVRDKLADPPVVVIDETARFVIPLLSGHVGGANALACELAAFLAAVPVVTTATDRNGLFAVDLFASGNGLALTDRKAAREISARILEGKTVGFVSDFPTDGIPKGCVPSWQEYTIWITIKDRLPKEADEKIRVLRLVPEAVTLGIGCRKGIPASVLKDRIDACLKEAEIAPEAVKRLASIDRKQEEKAIWELAKERGLDLCFYTAEELAFVRGDFKESEFVKETVGIGNVCERAACFGGGRLILKKRTGEGTAVAAACEALDVILCEKGFGSQQRQPQFSVVQ